MRKWIDAVPFMILPFIIGYFQFYKLGDLPFRIWDEARLATNAYEMVKSGDLIVTTVSHEPDLWNTKPPLMIWAQAASIKFLGFTEFAVRLPAALCGAATALLVFGFVSLITRSSWSGLASALVLCTAPGYLFEHGARNGEYDAMLTLFTTAYLISSYLYIETTGRIRDMWLTLFFVFLSGAVLTKGIEALLFTPAVLVCLLMNKRRLPPLLSNRYLYFGVFMFALLILGFYGIRELENPGYLKAVVQNELSGRFMSVKEGHSGPWGYYWDRLKSASYRAWYWTIPASLLTVWFYPDRRMFRAAGFFLTSAIFFVVVISASRTKLAWYLIPAFPLFAVIAGIFFHQAGSMLQTIIRLNAAASIVILTALFSYRPLVNAYHTLNFQDDLSKDDFYAPSYYFRGAVGANKDLDGAVYLYDDGYSLQWRLYVWWLNERGVRLQDRPYLDDRKLKAGDRLIANQPKIKGSIESRCNYKLVDEYYGLRSYLVTSVK